MTPAGSSSEANYPDAPRGLQLVDKLLQLSSSLNGSLAVGGIGKGKRAAGVKKCEEGERGKEWGRKRGRGAEAVVKLSVTGG